MNKNRTNQATFKNFKRTCVRRLLQQSGLSYIMFENRCDSIYMYKIIEEGLGSGQKLTQKIEIHPQIDLIKFYTYM